MSSRASRLEVRERASLTEALLETADPREVDLWWLGQAGFLLRMGATRLVVDPYLSDSLARKYAGTRFPHRRLTPLPFAAEALAPIDCVCVTHGHTDHMDPETLGPLARANPACKFIAPAAESTKAIERGVPEDRLIAVDAGDVVEIGRGLRVVALPAAHEELKRDADGRHLFLGYAFLGDGSPTIYHSGDCVPFAGLAERLSAIGVDLALLPVNGRDAYRRENGVPGNFTFGEAVELCSEAGIPHLIAHHFGMFAENTIDPAEAIRSLARPSAGVDVRFAAIEQRYLVRRA